VAKRVAIVVVAICICFGVAWLASLLLFSCNILAEAIAMQKIPEIQLQKEYGRWGQLECGSGWACDEDGLCCTHCVDLGNGEPVLRCHDLTPKVNDYVKGLYNELRR
jgi:hypothetical protein